MVCLISSAPSDLSLNDPIVAARVKEFRKPDNTTNWLHLAHVYLFLGAVAGLTLAFYFYREDWGLSWLWNIPVTILAVILLGAGQHRLTTLGHEASHYMLFHNRLLNELASDFLCMFPVWSTTHHYRLQHLAHHQFPNDPERDPDVTQCHLGDSSGTASSSRRCGCPASSATSSSAPAMPPPATGPAPTKSTAHARSS
jgi:hypothetical protein